MSELPVPAGLKNRKFDLSGKLAVKPVTFVEKELTPYSVEYTKRGNRLIFHFYKQGPFSMGFRARLYNVFMKRLGLVGKDSELVQIDWVPEFNSWCVIVKDLLLVSPPPSEETIDTMLKEICC